MKNLLDYFNGLSDQSKMMRCLLLCITLGVTDYLTRDISLTLFYVVPIAFASWFIGKRFGIFIAMLCGAELFIVDLFVAPRYVTVSSIRFWNSFMEIGYLVLTAYLVSTIRTEMANTRQKSLELAATNQDLEAFNYSVAHDLHSPLLWIGGFSRTILKKCGDRLEEQHRSNLQEIIDGVNRMERHIEALLNFSRLTRETLHREWFDLAEIVQTLVVELKRTAPERQVTFQIAEKVMVNGDLHLLRAVLQNLLGNAWKYTGKQQTAVIEFGIVDHAGIPACFVRDNGPGFDQTAAKKIFVPFQRLQGAEEFKGFGIGLATVQRIIHRHAGAIWAEATPGAGATFYFTLGPGRRDLTQRQLAEAGSDPDKCPWSLPFGSHGGLASRKGEAC
jgi:signal transduction histidine kinase